MFLNAKVRLTHLFSSFTSSYIFENELSLTTNNYNFYDIIM